MADQAGRVTDDARHDRAAAVVHRFRLVHDVPLHESHTEVRVHVIEYGARGDHQVPHCSGVTDRRVSQRHVYHLMRGGRARWKMANEPFKTLKHQGDHCEHHDGHGTKNLSVVCALVMRLALLVDQTPQLCGAWLQALWATLGRTRLLWERMRALFDDDALESRRPRLEALFDG